MTRIKVLHLFETYLPNTENWVYNLLLHLPNITNHIGAHSILDNSLKTNAFKYAVTAVDNKREKYIGSKKKGISRIIEKLGLEVYYLLNGNTPSKLVSYCKREKIEILHAHFGNVAWDYLSLKKKTHLPYIISFYGWDYEKLPHTRPIFKKRFQQLFKIADAFICEGNHGAKILEDLGCPKSKVHVVRLGINAQNINTVNRIKESGQLKLLQLASFTEKKGQLYVIKAIKEIIKICPNIRMTFIGDDRDGTTLKKMKNLVLELALSKFIEFLPAIDYHNLYRTLESHDVFIHPSCYASDRDCEGGAPIVLLDAQATGMPVISTTHCDIPDEVIHNSTGLLSEEKNVLALAESIERFYQMNNLEYQQFSKNARVHVEKNYNIISNSKELEKVYTKLLKK